LHPWDVLSKIRFEVKGWPRDLVTNPKHKEVMAV
jgi:hypothetical protein